MYWQEFQIILDICDRIVTVDENPTKITLPAADECQGIRGYWSAPVAVSV